MGQSAEARFEACVDALYATLVRPANTVRTLRKCVNAKPGVRSHAQLMTLVLALPSLGPVASAV